MNYAIIVAGGKGKRFSDKIKKQFYFIASKRIIDLTLKKFLNIPIIDRVVLVLPKEDIPNFRNLEIFKIVEGGTERVYSVLNALKSIKDIVKLDDKVLVHDGVRPFVSEDLIERILKELDKYDCVVPGVKVEDTVKIVEDGFIKETIDRNKIVRIQTPQGFKGKLVKDFIDIVDKSLGIFTDEASVFETKNFKIKLIEGEKRNVKITTKEDIMQFGANFRVGFGYDIHKFTENRKLILGGVEIDYNMGLEGHSDADVVIHSIIDAILGASGKPDIGEFFPDTETKFKGIKSEILLKEILKIVEKDFVINNLDVTIVCEKPKLKKYKEKIKKNLAKILNLQEDFISIKAKTNEKLDAVGEGKAISCYSVISLIKI